MFHEQKIITSRHGLLVNGFANGKRVNDCLSLAQW